MHKRLQQGPRLRICPSLAWASRFNEPEAEKYYRLADNV
jgi:hypothetical protein